MFKSKKLEEKIYGNIQRYVLQKYDLTIEKIQDIENRIEKIENYIIKDREEKQKDIKQKNKLMKYEYCIDEGDYTSSFSNKEDFQNYFIENVWEKKKFGANQKGWNAIYEILTRLEEIKE